MRGRRISYYPGRVARRWQNWGSFVRSFRRGSFKRRFRYYGYRARRRVRSGFSFTMRHKSMLAGAVLFFAAFIFLPRFAGWWTKTWVKLGLPTPKK